MIKILKEQTLQHKNSLKPKNKPSSRPSSLPSQNKSINRLVSYQRKQNKIIKHQNVQNQDIVLLLKQYEVQLPKKFIKYDKSNINQHKLTPKQKIDEDMLCLDQDIQSLMTCHISVRKPQSAMSRYSNDLEIIEERAFSQEDVQQMLERKNQENQFNSEEKPKSKKIYQQSTTAETKTKTKVKSKMLYDPFVRPFIEPIKMNINVIDVLRNRRKQLQRSYASSKLNITK